MPIAVNKVRKKIHAIIGDGKPKVITVSARKKLQLLADDLFKRNKTYATRKTIERLALFGINKIGASGKEEEEEEDVEEDEEDVEEDEEDVEEDEEEGEEEDEEDQQKPTQSAKKKAQLEDQLKPTQSAKKKAQLVDQQKPTQSAKKRPPHVEMAGLGLAPGKRIESNEDYGKGLKKKTFIYTEAKASRGRLGEFEVHEMIMDGGVNYPTIDTDRRGHKGNLKSEREKLYPITTFFRGKNLTPANDLRKYCMKAPKTRQAWKLLKDNSDIARFYNESRGGYKSIGGERPRASVTFYNPVNPGK